MLVDPPILRMLEMRLGNTVSRRWISITATTEPETFVAHSLLEKFCPFGGFERHAVGAGKTGRDKSNISGHLEFFAIEESK